MSTNSKTSSCAPPSFIPAQSACSSGDDFRFANPASILGPDEELPLPADADRVETQMRLAVVIGAGVIGGFTLLNDLLAPQLHGAKASDFGTSTGRVVVTPDEFDGGGVDWHDLLDRAEQNTRFYPGDIVAGPVIARSGPHSAGDTVEVEFLDGIGVLRNYLSGMPPPSRLPQPSS